MTVESFNNDVLPHCLRSTINHIQDFGGRAIRNSTNIENQ